MRYKVKILFGFSGLMMIMGIVYLFSSLVNSNIEKKIDLLLVQRFPVEQSINSIEQIIGHLRTDILYSLVLSGRERRTDLEEIDTFAFSFKLL